MARPPVDGAQPGGRGLHLARAVGRRPGRRMVARCPGGRTFPAPVAARRLGLVSGALRPEPCPAGPDRTGRGGRGLAAVRSRTAISRGGCPRPHRDQAPANPRAAARSPRLREMARSRPLGRDRRGAGTAFAARHRTWRPVRLPGHPRPRERDAEQPLLHARLPARSRTAELRRSSVGRGAGCGRRLLQPRSWVRAPLRAWHRGERAGGHVLALAGLHNPRPGGVALLAGTATSVAAAVASRRHRRRRVRVGHHAPANPDRPRRVVFVSDRQAGAKPQSGPGSSLTRVAAADVRVPHARWAIALAALIVCAALLYLTRTYTFYFDEWTFITSAPDWTLRSYFEPHNEHPVMLLRLVYSLLLETAGLRTYLPYMAALLLAHPGARGLVPGFRPVWRAPEPAAHGRQHPHRSSVCVVGPEPGRGWDRRRRRLDRLPAPGGGGGGRDLALAAGWPRPFQRRHRGRPARLLPGRRPHPRPAGLAAVGSIALRVRGRVDVARPARGRRPPAALARHLAPRHRRLHLPGLLQRGRAPLRVCERQDSPDAARHRRPPGPGRDAGRPLPRPGRPCRRPDHARDHAPGLLPGGRPLRRPGRRQAGPRRDRLRGGEEPFAEDELLTRRAPNPRRIFGAHAAHLRPQLLCCSFTLVRCAHCAARSFGRIWATWIAESLAECSGASRAIPTLESSARARFRRRDTGRWDGRFPGRDPRLPARSEGRPGRGRQARRDLPPHRLHPHQGAARVV